MDAENNPIDDVYIIALSKNEYENYLKKIGGDYETYKDGVILIDNNINMDEKEPDHI